MRPRPAAALLAAGLLAACGGGSDGGTSGGAGGAATTSSAPAAPTDAEAAAPSSTPTAPDAVSDPDGGDEATPPPGASPPATAPPDAPLDASGPPGSFAPSVLRPAASSRVVLELQVAAGAEPDPSVVEHVRSTLAAASGKPVVVTSVAAPSTTTWSSSTVRAAADADAATLQGGGTAVLRLLFVRGSFGGDTSVLGIAVRGDVAAVFVDQTSAAAGLLGSPAEIATSVATHEVGHLLGLVDLVLATGRADPQHPGHSSNPSSVMYWAVETDLIGALLGAHPPIDFDADDLADLRTIAGG